jgi:hypothetical protein
MRLDYSGAKITQIFIVTNRFSHSLSRRNNNKYWTGNNQQTD